MKNLKILAVAFAAVLCSSYFIEAQTLATPAQKCGYTKLTTYPELAEFVKELGASSPLLSVKTIGSTKQGRDIFALKFSNKSKGQKTKLLIFAQQHGNEQSGKEGALLLAEQLVRPENRYLFNRLEVTIIPISNPDGSEVNKRRNSAGMDLNRNHLIVTEPEVIAQQNLFDKELFDVTMDVHEYYPYGEESDSLGFHRNADECIGYLTNPDVSRKIKEFQFKEFTPFYSKYLQSHGDTWAFYTPGGVPDKDYFRFSTYDVNDGRQYYGILNTLSFIQEGKNGKDVFVENLEHRAVSQCDGMMALIKFSYNNSEKIKKLVASERRRITEGEDKYVSLRMEHRTDGTPLALHVQSNKTGKDSIVNVKEFRSKVVTVDSIRIPAGYLIPKSNEKLCGWIARQHFKTAQLNSYEAKSYEVTKIIGEEKVDFEDDIISLPKTSADKLSWSGFTAKYGKDILGKYIFVPARQLKCKLLVVGLEPTSELGLSTYDEFEDLVKPGLEYPVIRVN
ncbi:MAG: hypothetical protein LKM33_01395 [Bacteroidales bacterium]|jgi:hypothetical protein|nr:hypothetical protein [Bacteroidales bacterium]